MLVAVIFVSLYFFTTSHAASNCLSPELKKQAITCVESLTPLFNELKKSQAANFDDKNSYDKLNQLCETSLKCFKTLEKCAEIPKEVIDGSEDMCSLTKFVNGPKFSQCMKTIDAKKDKCTTELFVGPQQLEGALPPQIYWGDREDKCDNYKKNGDCARKFIATSCSADALKAFDSFKTETTKRLKC
ncbi:unnamed protein product [Caenorhabditis angaria]|uniref:T20D4.11-like domain-containing protein n=1 Tax=Caenorhabditis angaria TaxID=860376 RepID=A0A9P1IX28_9PELO|nr:unnamed protein product [Caenorhabditis angaria]